jgi:hypothetical protein
MLMLLDIAGTGLLNGRSEQLLGQFIAEAGSSAQYPVLVASKFAAYPWRLTAGACAETRKLSPPSASFQEVLVPLSAVAVVLQGGWWQRAGARLGD